MPPPAFRPGVRTSLVYLTLSEELAASTPNCRSPA